MDSEIKFRVATESKALFEAAAEKDGRKLSDWVRRACVEKVGQSWDKLSEKVLPKDPKEVAEMVSGVKLADEMTPKTKIVTEKSRPLTREEREARMASAQGWLTKGKK